MDSTTFSDTKGAMRLAEILDETNDDNITKNVSRFLHRIGNTLNELKAVKSDSIREHFFVLYRADRLEKIKFMAIPHVIRTHLLNVVAAKFRNFHKKAEEMNTVWIVMSAARGMGYVNSVTAHSSYELAKNSADKYVDNHMTRNEWEWETDFYGCDDADFITIGKKVVDSDF
jgi:hypothetical protein